MAGLARARRGAALAAMACLVLTLPAIPTAHAQSSPSPYAGSWHGQSVIWGPTTCGGQVSPSCTLTRPWSGTVDENGLFTYVYGPGGTICPDGSYTPDPGGDSHQVSVPPGGAVQLGYWSANCLRNVQFSASPALAVSGSLLECTYQYVSQPSGTVCTHTVSATFTGKGTSTAFPMAVTSNIGATVSSATASIRYRAQDVGTSASVYAFAVAPATLAKAAPGDGEPLEVGFARSAGKDSPVACVLAQLDASGQLRAVSASQLQAYVTGVLSSQGQSVTILDNVATANIGGAVFYVGYGATPAAMLDGNVLNRAVLVPGAVQCDPQPPQSGWWWNAAEDGRGYTIESTGTKVFFAAYLYDISGRSTWYIAAGPTTLEGSLFVGDLESYTNGQTLTGAFRSPVRPPVLNGQVTLAFNDAQHGTLSWPGGTIPITRMEYGVGGVNAVPQANQPENGWWLSGLDDGRGFFIEWQAGTAFMAGFMYDEVGAPVWYIAAKPRTDNAQVFSSQWEKYVNGQTLTGTYHPPVRPPTYAGPATIQFSGPANAVMTMPGGAQVTLSRYRF